VVTRFPPEPNGYLHIGHAKSICLNFGIASETIGGVCHLRFDDTNPLKEEEEFVQAIQEDVKWLGFDWKDKMFFTSDYFDRLYQCAVQLTREGKAYVCSLSPDDVRKTRGTLTAPGTPSPYRERTPQENLDLFERMRRGEFEEGTHTLRAKIDMASPNLNMRDPAIYRIRKMAHHRTGDKWCIYPMYDFAHCLSDSFEGITHSLCTLEFEDHRPLYDWFLDALKSECHPSQIEFARLKLNHTLMSKRKLAALVEEGAVSGWDDPRMPTLSGLRRRGYTPFAIRDFCERIGVAKVNSTVDSALLEHCLREELNRTAPRVMAVLHPLKLIIDNYPEDKVEELTADNNPENQDHGSRNIPFSRVLYIEREDFKEDLPKKFFRLGIGREVRLKHAYYVTCTSVEKDSQTGEILAVHCTYDPATRGGWSEDGRKVKGTLHWVSVPHAESAEVRLFDPLYLEEEGTEPLLNPQSRTVLKECKVEPSLKKAALHTSYQFLRQGYFCLDSRDSAENFLVFNRSVALRDTWGKIRKKNQ